MSQLGGAYARMFAPTVDLSNSQPALHSESKGPAYPFTQLPINNHPPLASDSTIPVSAGPVWDGNVPFSFRKRTGRVDWNTILNLDLEKIVREKDVRTLEKHMNNLTYSDLLPDDLTVFDAVDGKGVANSVHLFRLWQLQSEAQLHVQSFLLKALQAKETQIASEILRAQERAAKEGVLVHGLKARIAALQKELKVAQDKVVGFERAGAKIQPVTYLPAAATQGQSNVLKPQYPGEVYTCALCANAFVSPHYLTQHYQRRHPGFVHPAQSVVVQKPVSEEKENIKPAPQGVSEAEVARQMAALREQLSFSLEKQFAALAAQKRLEEQRALLARLTSLEQLMRAQFSARSIPPEMLTSQQAIYQSLLKEIEDIRREVARSAGAIDQLNQVADVQWNVQQQQSAVSQSQAKSPAKIDRALSPARVVDATSPVKPAAVSVKTPQTPISPQQVKRIDASSPTDQDRPILPPTPAPAPKPIVEVPQPEPAQDPRALSHLSRENRLQQVLLSRTNQTYAPFKEYPTLRSRYAEQDWNPSAMEQREQLSKLVDQLSLPENQDAAMRVEQTMHQQPEAESSYNSVHDAVELLASRLEPEPSLVAKDRELAERWAFCNQWEILIREKEERERKSGKTARDVAEDRARREALAQKLDSEAAALQKAKVAEEQEKLLAQQRQERRNALLQRPASVVAQQQPPAPAPAGVSVMVSPSQSAISATPVSSPSALPSPTPSNTGSDFSTWAPYGSTNIGGASQSTANAQLPPPAAAAAPAQPQEYAGAQIMRQPEKSPISAIRPEGYSNPLASPTPINTIMPRTPAVTGAPVKSALAVLTPSVRQQQMLQAQSTPAETASQPQYPPQIGGYSPSSSLNSSAASSFGSASQGYGGVGIMQRSVNGPLDHISEGASMDDSAAVNTSTATTVLNANAAPIIPAPVPIPRTEVDDEFEAMLSPRKVAPRTQPSILVSPTSSVGTPQSQWDQPSSTRSMSAASNFMVNESPNSTNVAASAAAASSSSNAPARSLYVAPVSTREPGAFPFGATPLATTTSMAPPASSQGPGYTPHTYNVGGHAFHFDKPPLVVEESPREEEEEFPHYESVADQKVNQSFDAEAAATRAAKEQARREEEEALGLPSFSTSTTSGANAIATAGVAPSSNASASSSSRFNPFSASRSRGLDDSTETITLDAEERKYPPPASRVLSPSYEQQIKDQTTVTTGPVTAAPVASNKMFEPTPSPSSMISQPGRPESSSPPVIPPRSGYNLPTVRAPGMTQAFSSNTPPVPASVATATPNPLSSPSSTHVQPFEASPSSSFSQVGAQSQQVLSSPSANAVQPFVASPSVLASPAISSPSPAPVSSSATTTATATTTTVLSSTNQPTFLSEFPDEDDEFPMDEPTHGQPAPVTAATSSSTTTIATEPSPVSTTVSSSSAAPPRVREMPVVLSSDDEADVADSDDEEALYGRKVQKKGTEVITPGSVSNARAQLLSQGFALRSGTGSSAPTMSELKEAHAARLASDPAAAAAAEAEAASTGGGLLPAAKIAKPKPAAARKTRTTFQGFVAKTNEL